MAPRTRLDEAHSAGHLVGDVVLVFWVAVSGDVGGHGAVRDRRSCAAASSSRCRPRGVATTAAWCWRSSWCCRSSSGWWPTATSTCSRCSSWSMCSWRSWWRARWPTTRSDSWSANAAAVGIMVCIYGMSHAPARCCWLEFKNWADRNGLSGFLPGVGGADLHGGAAPGEPPVAPATRRTNRAAASTGRLGIGAGRWVAAHCWRASRRSKPGRPSRWRLMACVAGPDLHLVMKAIVETAACPTGAPRAVVTGPAACRTVDALCFAAPVFFIGSLAFGPDPAPDGPRRHVFIPMRILGRPACGPPASAWWMWLARRLMWPAARSRPPI